MKNGEKNVIHVIDATGQSMGRVASEAAQYLMGKNMPNFRRHATNNISVRIENVAKLKVPQMKLKSKDYKRYTGYPSGLKKESLQSLSKRHGYSRPLQIAIRGMLPNNKLRSVMLKNLSIEE